MESNKWRKNRDWRSETHDNTYTPRGQDSSLGVRAMDVNRARKPCSDSDPMSYYSKEDSDWTVLTLEPKRKKQRIGCTNVPGNHLLRIVNKCKGEEFNTHGSKGDAGLAEQRVDQQNDGRFSVITIQPVRNYVGMPGQRMDVRTFSEVARGINMTRESNEEQSGDVPPPYLENQEPEEELRGRAEYKDVLRKLHQWRSYLAELWGVRGREILPVQIAREIARPTPPPEGFTADFLMERNVPKDIVHRQSRVILSILNWRCLNRLYRLQTSRCRQCHSMGHMQMVCRNRRVPNAGAVWLAMGHGSLPVYRRRRPNLRHY